MDNNELHHNVKKERKVITHRGDDTPAILLEGKWLEKKYGLKVGDTVSVDYEENKIVIKTND